MFKLVAILFLAANPSEPIGGMTYNQAVFSSKDACGAFVESDGGKAATERMKVMAKSQSIEVRFACVKGEDNTI